MSRQRFIYYFLAVFFALAGLASGIRVFFVLLAGQVFLIITALLMNLWASLSFTYLQDISSRQTLRGQPVHLYLALHNEKPIPYPLMHIRLATPDHRENRELDFNLAGNTQLDFNLIMECPHRGEYPIGMTIINFSDVFGLIHMPFDMRMLPYYRMQNLLVYPRLAELEDVALPALGSKSFSRNTYATEDQEEPFSMLRDYRRGDPRKLIHWKASARQQKLQTRQFDQSAEPSILLIMDLEKPAVLNEAALQAIDVSCECMAALSSYIMRQNWPLQIVSLGHVRQVLSGRNIQDFQPLYHWLATVAFDGQQPFTDQLTIEMNRSKTRNRDDRQNARAIIVVTVSQQPQIINALRQRSVGLAPVYTIVACPAEVQPGESALHDQLRRSGFPAWFIHYGDDLTERLRWRS